MKKKLKGRRRGIKGYWVGDKEGCFIVPKQSSQGDIEPFAIFRLKKDAQDFAHDFQSWHNPVIIKPIYYSI